MTNSNLRTENHFDYVKISIASPQRIMDWGQRTLPNGQVVGEVTKPETINYRTLLNQRWMAYSVKKFLVLLKIGSVIVESIKGLGIEVLYARDVVWRLLKAG